MMAGGGSPTDQGDKRAFWPDVVSRLGSTTLIEQPGMDLEGMGESR